MEVDQNQIYEITRCVHGGMAVSDVLLEADKCNVGLVKLVLSRAYCQPKKE